MTRARFRAIDIREDLFGKRDQLLKGSPADITRAEEDRRKQRAERWEKAVAVFRKKTNTASGTKLPTTSQKEVASIQAGASQSTVPETDPGESRKKQKTDPTNTPITSAAGVIIGQNPPSGETVATPGSEVPASGDSGKNTITESEAVNPTATEKNPTPNPEQTQKESESGVASTQKESESQNPEHEQTQQTEGE